MDLQEYSADPARTDLSCRIGGLKVLIPAEAVAGMDNSLLLTPLPGAPPYILGLCYTDEGVIAAIDLKPILDLHTVSPAGGGQYVRLSLPHGSQVALLVDDVDDAPPLVRPGFEHIAGDNPFGKVMSDRADGNGVPYFRLSPFRLMGWLLDRQIRV